MSAGSDFLLGSNQLLKLSQAESSYAETIETPSWTELGVIESGEAGGKTSDQQIFGIGSASSQLRYAGRVENTLRASIVSPSAANLMRAITRTSNVLASYNFIIGDVSNAWRGVGLKFDSLDLELDNEKPLTASMDGIFKSILAAEVSDGGAHDPGDIAIWQPEGLVLSVGGVADTGLVSAKISVKNNLEGKGVANSSNTPKRTISRLKEGNLVIDVTLQTYTEPTFSIEDDCLAQDVALSAVYTDLCNNGTPATLTIALTGGMYLEKRQPLKPGDYADYSIGMSFTAISIT